MMDSSLSIYIAAPLFNVAERARNARLRGALELIGFDTYLPQDDGGLFYTLVNEQQDVGDVRRMLFERDVAAVRNCDILVCILDGRVPDEGTCVELGMAYTLNKRCLGLKTDSRALDKFGGNNIMIDGCLEVLCTSEEELEQILREAVKGMK